MNLEEAQMAIQDGLRKNMVLVSGPCIVKYQGRAGSKLAEGERILMIKRDGTFLIHQNEGFKPVNYQPPGTRISLEREDDELVVRARRRDPKELIEVTFPEVNYVKNIQLRDDEDIDIHGTERQLADMLMQDLSVIEKGMKTRNKESPLPQGDVDIFAEDKDGKYTVIEVKRKKAGLDAVSQLKRYVEEVKKRKDKDTRGILCAPGVSDKAKKHLENSGLEFSELDFEIMDHDKAEIKGLTKTQKGLSEFQ